MAKHLLKLKSHMDWSWILIVGFFALSVLHFAFGLLGFACMITPMVHAFKGKGKIHCSHYCPRGSFFGKFLPSVSTGRKLPDFMRTKWFKNLLLGAMVSMLTLAMVHADGNLVKMGFALLRFMVASSVVGVLMGIFFKPRSWCQVCPMAHATTIITDFKEKKKSA